MTDPIARSQDAVRLASKAAKVLLISSAILLLALAAIFATIIARQDSLRDSIREDRLWATYQFDREARTLDNLIDHYVLSPVVPAPRPQELGKRYDILYSRLTLLEEASFDEKRASLGGTEQERQEARALTLGMQEFFDSLVQGRMPSNADILATREKSSRLSQVTGELLNKTNAAVSEARTVERDEILSLQRFSAIIVVTICFTIGLLILSLLRQVKLFKLTSQELGRTTATLGEAYALAEAGNRAKSEFMATIGHEIRTPLNAILGLSELLSYARLSPADHESVAAINSSGTALLEIINEILDFTKLEAGPMSREQLPYQPVALATELIRVMRSRAEAKRTRIDLVCDGIDENGWFMGDPTHIRRILFNLLGNAIKFTDNGIIRLSIRAGEAGKMHFAVVDTGIGIPESARSKLFQPFSQVDSSTSRRFGGTGLGLAICKRIVEELGGSIGVESSPGIGSQFWFDVPAAVADAPEPERTPPAPAPAPSPARGLHILVAEDHPMNRDVIRQFLEKLNQSADVVTDGAEAVAAVMRRHYDLVIMDMQMPVMDGIEATRNMRKLGINVPIVALTANASDSDRDACIEAGMNGFESKPISLAALSGMLRRFGSMDGAEAGTSASAAPAATTGKIHRIDELRSVVGEDGVQALIGAFTGELPRLMTKLHAAVTEGNAGEIDLALHTIKGSAANLGLSTLSDLAQSLRGLPPERIDIGQVEAECSRAVGALNQQAA